MGHLGAAATAAAEQRRSSPVGCNAHVPALCYCLLAGSGRTGFFPVPPNNYPFYNDDEKYVPIMQADGGQLSGAGGMCARAMPPAVQCQPAG